MTNPTFELENLPDVPGGTWKIINCSNDPNREAPFVVRLSVEGQAPIEVGIPRLEESIITAAVTHAHCLHEEKKRVPGLEENDEIALVPKPPSD